MHRKEERAFREPVAVALAGYGGLSKKETSKTPESSDRKPSHTNMPLPPEHSVSTTASSHRRDFYMCS